MLRVTLIVFLLSCFSLANVPSRAEEQTNDYEQMIRSLGYDPSQTKDWSKDSVINLPQPAIAYINLHSKYGIPYTKTSNFKDSIEYFDAMGNYFMKRAIVNVQGATSTVFPKRNFQIQLIDDEWIGEVTPTVDFDGWVEQDKFHIKAFYTDWLRGVGIIGYQLFNQIEMQEPEEINRIWKRAGVDGHKNARCYPDGFPCMLYLNGQFYGIYVWQLSKHRRNMSQQKHNVSHIHLDGNMGDNNFWNGTVIWSSFDVRNPKDMYDMNGKPYEEKNELMDESSPYFDLPDDTKDVREAKQRSASVKKAVIKFSQLVSKLNTMKKNGASHDEIRQEIALHFDVESMLNYLVFSTVVSNYDGFTKNWQWVTYDGEKWYVAPYDLDCIFGNYQEGTFLFPARFSYTDSDYRFDISRRGIATWFWDYYFDELKQKYTELRDNDIISLKNISSLVHQWYDRIGFDNFEKEWEAWPNSLCISQTITNPGWAETDDWTDHFNHIPIWDASVTYRPGDLCKRAQRIWLATDETQGVFPFLQLGYTDSLERIDNWIGERIDLEDDFFEYEPQEAKIFEQKAGRKPIGVYSIEGSRRSKLKSGMNIVQYSDGTLKIWFIK